MKERDAATRDLIRVKLAQSREEIRMLLDPPPGEVGGAEAAAKGLGGFPRSRTMRALLSSRGLGAVGALAGGLLIARPALALRLLRLVPASTVAKMLMTKAVDALKAKPANSNGP